MAQPLPRDGYVRRFPKERLLERQGQGDHGVWRSSRALSWPETTRARVKGTKLRWKGAHMSCGYAQNPTRRLLPIFVVVGNHTRGNPTS